MTNDVPDRSRWLGFRRAIATLAVSLLALSFAGELPASHAAGPSVSTARPVVVLMAGHVVRAKPTSTSRRIGHVDVRRPLTGVRTKLPVLGYAENQAWVLVLLPGRPNGHTGWIRTSQTRQTVTIWRIALDLSARRLAVFRSGRVAKVFPVIVGTPSTPTPRGRFFIEEPVALTRSDSGEPFALATSARSNVYQEFDGGPGQIALHGMGNLSGALGSASSHGCVRLGRKAITWMARRIGPGIPLTISR